MASQTNSFEFSNVSTNQTFTVNIGGLFGVTYSATFGGGSIQLNVLAGDGSTEVAAVPSWTANGTALVYLPAGSYQLAITTATAVYVNIIGIPGN